MPGEGECREVFAVLCEEVVWLTDVRVGAVHDRLRMFLAWPLVQEDGVAVGEGVPVDENVAAIFRPIKPDLPIPVIITRPFDL